MTLVSSTGTGTRAHRASAWEVHVHMGEPLASVVPIRRDGQLFGFVHRVSVVLPRRRYRPDVRPVPCDGSPSRIGVDPEERHGALLWAERRSLLDEIDPQEFGEMVGELAESWVLLTAWTTSSAE